MSSEARFLAARLAVISDRPSGTGIGTLSEKLTHKILKHYVEPDSSMHEVKYLGFVADVKNADGIWEIQTRSFEKLKPKLDRFLAEGRVTVVLPLVGARYINYIDKSSGEALFGKKSPLHHTINFAACELYKLSDLILHPNLRVKIIFLEYEEYRYKTTSKSSKRDRALDVIPSRILKEMLLFCREDYRCFIPKELGRRFTASDLSRLIKLDSRRTHNTISLLQTLGLVKRVGSEGRAFLYEQKTGIDF